jgi:hypothetical protein
LAWFARLRGGSSGSACGTPFFPRVLVHLVGLGVVVRQRLMGRRGQCPGLDLVAEPEQVLAADSDLASELGGRLPLGDAAEDQEDLHRAVMGALPGSVSVHVEDPAAALASMIDDRRVGATAVDVEAIAGPAAGAGEPLGVEEIGELPAACLLVHEVDDREVHEAASEE